MTIKPDVVEYVRTMLADDHAANDHIQGRLDQDGWDGYPTLLGAVFFHAVNLHFGGSIDDPTIVRFVAAMRTDEAAEDQNIDPVASETLIKAALDPAIDFHVEPEQVGKIQTLAILKIMEARKLGPSELDDLLKKSTNLAERHSS